MKIPTFQYPNIKPAKIPYKGFLNTCAEVKGKMKRGMTVPPEEKELTMAKYIANGWTCVLHKRCYGNWELKFEK